MSDPRQVCVLLGGPSSEREVSLRSGAAVARALRELGHAVSEVDPLGRWDLPAGTELVYLALHGTYGEDGAVQQWLEDRGVPYTGCGPEASRLAFDKVLTKRRLVEAGVPTAPFVVVDSPASPWPEGWRPPVVIKPVRQGSSVGLQFVAETGEWPAAVATALRHDREALVEEQILGRELTVGILEDRALPLVEVRPRQGAYDYHNKYTSGATEYLCPAPLEESVARAAASAGLAAFRAVGGRDYGRVDVMLRPTGEPVVLEVNTLPGMTETSLLPKAAAAAGIPFSDLCQRMLDLAWRRASGAGTNPITPNVAQTQG